MKVVSICAVLVYILRAEHVVHGECTLDRNEYNKYPWMLRVVIGKVLKCHGVLITPEYMILAFNPLKEMISGKNYSNVDIVGTMYGPHGQVECTATRTLTSVDALSYNFVRVNLAIGVIGNPFSVTFNNPYMYSRISDYSMEKFEKNFAELIDFECCLIPVFDSMTAEKPGIVEHKVTYIKGPCKTEEYWTNVTCKDSPVCCEKVKYRNFFVYDPEGENNPHYSYYEGAALICDGNPLAVIEAQIIDPSTSKKITMMQHVKENAMFFGIRAAREWPKSTSKPGGRAAKYEVNLELATKQQGEGMTKKEYEAREREPDINWKNGATTYSKQTFKANMFTICMIIRAIRVE